MRKQKGITLISLIITVILLLILLGTSLGIILQGDFFYKARKTAKMTEGKVQNQDDKIEQGQNDWEQMEVSFCSHIWEEEQVILEPTCTIPGKELLKCTNCGKTMEKEIPKRQHDLSDWVSNFDGTHSRTCVNCDYIATEAHTYQNGECIKCGIIVFYVSYGSKSEYTSPKGLTWQEWCETDYNLYETSLNAKRFYTSPNGAAISDKANSWGAGVVATEGTYDTMVLPTEVITPGGEYRIYIMCLAWDTEISVVYEDEKGRKRVKKKKIQDLKPGDEILSFDWKTMKLVPNKVKYVDGNENKTHYQYDKWIFDDGTIIKTVHKHEFYNVEAKRFKYMDEWNIGDHAYKQDGTKPRLVAHELITEVVKHCTIVGENGTNYFANDLLSGDRTCPKNITL